MPHDHALGLYQDAAYRARETGGRIWMGQDREGRPVLRIAKNTLFGRTVYWLRDALFGSGKKATRHFLHRLEAKYDSVVATAARTLAERKLRAGTPLKDVILDSINGANKAQRALTEFRPGTSKFTAAAAAVGVIAEDLSAKQLAFAAALIQFEVATRIEAHQSLDEDKLKEIAGSAAKLAKALGDDELPGTLWFKGESSIGDELDRLKTDNPRKLAMLELAFREGNDNDYSGLYNVREAVKKASALLRAPYLQTNIIECFPAKLFSDKPSLEDLKEVQKIKESFSTSEAEITEMLLDPSVSFATDWNREDLPLPIDITTDVEAQDEQSPDEAVTAALEALAERSPGVNRVLRNLDADGRKLLEDFKRDIAKLEPGAEPVTKVLPAQGKQIEVFQSVKGKKIEFFTKDSPLKLDARRKDDGAIEIRARMAAQMANSGSMENALKELTAFIGGDQDAARKLARVLHQGATAHAYRAAVGADAFKNADGYQWMAHGIKHHKLSPSLADNGDVVVDVSMKTVLTDTLGEPPIPLDPDESRFELEWRFRVDGKSLKAKDGEPKVTSERPIDATLRVKLSLPGARPDKALNPGDPLDEQEIASRNDLLLALYAPGGPKAGEIWDRSGEVENDFTDAQKDLIEILMTNEVIRAGGTRQLTPDDMLEIADKAIKAVTKLREDEAKHILNTDADLSTEISNALYVINEREGPEALLDILENVASLRSELLKGLGLDENSADEKAGALYPAIHTALESRSPDWLERFVDRAFESREIQAFLALLDDISVSLGPVKGLSNEERHKIVEWGELLINILQGAMHRLERGAEFSDKYDRALDAASYKAKEEIRGKAKDFFQNLGVDGEKVVLPKADDSKNDIRSDGDDALTTATKSFARRLDEKKKEKEEENTANDPINRPDFRETHGPNKAGSEKLPEFMRDDFTQEKFDKMLETPGQVGPNEKFYSEPQAFARCGIHAINAFLGGKVASVDEINGFLQHLQKTDPQKYAVVTDVSADNGTDEVVPELFLNYLFRKQVSPHRVKLDAYHADKEVPDTLPEIPGDRVIIEAVGKSKPKSEDEDKKEKEKEKNYAHFVTFRKDTEGNWRLIDSMKHPEQEVKSPQAWFDELREEYTIEGLCITMLHGDERDEKADKG